MHYSINLSEDLITLIKAKLIGIKEIGNHQKIDFTLTANGLHLHLYTEFSLDCNVPETASKVQDALRDLFKEVACIQLNQINITMVGAFDENTRISTNVNVKNDILDAAEAILDHTDIRSAAKYWIKKLRD